METRIRQVRKENHYTQERLAQELGLSRIFINQIEKGKENPSDRTIKDICRIFNINEAWLRTGEGEMYAPMNKDEEVAVLINDLMSIDDDSIKLEYYKLIHDADEELLKTLASTVKLFINEKNRPAE